MTNYSFSINEEISRWATEVYINTNPKFGWWIAFTNPTAGPWKKITAPDENNTMREIYRFFREEERPDLILVSDEQKAIIIVEAKDSHSKLISSGQMSKSIRVIISMIKVLQECKHPIWNMRKNYKIMSSFLWYCSDESLIAKECSAVNSCYDSLREKISDSEILDIVIYKDDEERLMNCFLYRGQRYNDLDFKI